MKSLTSYLTLLVGVENNCKAGCGYACARDYTELVSPGERLAQLEASHIKLMTGHELEVKKNDRAWKRHRRWIREYEARRERDRLEQERRWAEADERGRVLDDRIAKLVSGIGQFMLDPGAK